MDSQDIRTMSFVVTPPQYSEYEANPIIKRLGFNSLDRDLVTSYGALTDTAVHDWEPEGAVAIRFFTIDKPWLGAEGIRTQMLSRRGNVCTIRQLLHLVEIHPEVLTELTLLVALGSRIRKVGGFASIWFDTATSQRGLGLLPLDQQFRRGDAFPYWVPPNR
jgi:hypothetical protein